jgi:arylsulfatase A
MKLGLGAIHWAAPLLLPLHASAGENRPTIVPIVCDDLGRGDVQSLNPERSKIKPPHIDNRASPGMVFTDAHPGFGAA